ncbi:MAG: hydrophobic/amphiphilic exporter-1 (mainly G- bacteria), HAE1 family [Elusimicrobia bacterium]|nr:MAG: hydrophobic/amphiphilic exporter-1 (mainly G- bacteria), HAE1 family [Elusimicrobiota bacterium]
MTLSDLAIKKPVFAWMLMAALLLFGGVTFSRLGVSQNPDVDSPVVNIRLSWEGAAPQIMENEVIDPVEEALMTVAGIEKVRSTSRFGAGTVTAEFGLDKDIDVAVQEVQTKLAQAQRNLPRDLDPPQKVNPEDQPILWVGVSGTRPYREMSAYTRDHLLDRSQTVPGAGEVSLGGFVEPNLRVWLNPEKMRDLQMTVDDVVAAISSQHSELPGGVLQSLTEETSVRVMGEAASVEEFGNITIPSRVGQGILWRTIRIKDIAEIEEGLADVRRLSRVNGETSIGMGIRKQRGSNAVAVARAVKARIAEVNAELPEGMKIGVLFDTTKFIEDNIHELQFALGLAVALTALVCWLFLGSWSSTLNVVLAIPTALGGTVVVMYFMGFTLNTITLMAISLVIGIVVDDAIVVLENISRHREEGKPLVKAAVDGAREIMFSVIVISSAVIAIFLPVAFMEGITGKFFYEFGVTISVAVAFSLLEAVTLAPMRCSQFLEVGHSTGVGRFMDAVTRRLTAAYSVTLGWALGRRWGVLAAAALLFAGSLRLASGLRREMTPAQDTGTFIVKFQAPPGSSLAATDEAFKKVEAYLAARPEILRYFGNIGGGQAGAGGEVNAGTVNITMKPLADRPRSQKSGKPVTQQELMGVLRKGLKEIKGLHRVSLQDRSQSIGGGGGRGSPIELSLQGPDWTTLGEKAEELRTKLHESGLAVDVETSYVLGVPEVRIVPDREKAAARGVTVAAIARTINSTVGGVRAGRYTKGGRRYDIRVSLRDKNRAAVADISKLYVRNVRGELVTLSEVTAVLSQATMLSVQREDRQRAVSVFGNVAPGKSQADAIAEAQKIATSILPEGYHLAASGNSSQFKDAFHELNMALLLGIAIAYMILAAQFNSFLHPFVILLALPFSLSGALGALWAFDHSLNMMSLIGILLLMGIVKKNSILLVEFTNHKRAEGLSVQEALLTACPLRLRPILMTSLAIVAGAAPAALTFGPGAELRAPMSAAVIGGTLVSTLLTLYVVPCAYSLLSRLESTRHASRVKEIDEALAS